MRGSLRLLELNMISCNNLQHFSFRLQAVCGVYKEQACKIAKEESPYNMTACDMKCCQTEKCNTQALVAPRSTAPYTNPTFMFHLLASLAVLAY